jgi:hypothetical protein
MNFPQENCDREAIVVIDTIYCPQHMPHVVSAVIAIISRSIVMILLHGAMCEFFISYQSHVNVCMLGCLDKAFSSVHTQQSILTRSSDSERSQETETVF